MNVIDWVDFMDLTSQYGIDVVDLSQDEINFLKVNGMLEDKKMMRYNVGTHKNPVYAYHTIGLRLINALGVDGCHNRIKKFINEARANYK